MNGDNFEQRVRVIGLAVLAVMLASVFAVLVAVERPVPQEFTNLVYGVVGIFVGGVGVAAFRK